ncbi:MAG: hypothetical protein Q9187_000945, partial [Circinaria calcarea]
SKSSGHLSSLHQRSPSSKSLKATDSTDWILQTASALTNNTAESKGQCWLATRTSSTSLVDVPPYSLQRRASSAEADDEFSISPDSVKHTSKPHSRFTSAKNSRRGSRVGAMTPLGLRTLGEADDRDDAFFGAQGPQFVDVDERDEDVGDEVDEGEMRRRRKRDESDRIVIGDKEPRAKGDVPPPPADGGWKDAAWLLSIATKILI